VTFKQALRYLDNLQEKIVKFDLKTMQELVKTLDVDLSKLKVIHIAGSNGKGSTSAFITSILKESGYNVGTYTSPHLVSITERIKINNKNISEKEFERLFFEIKNVSKRMKTIPSYFETLTAIALKYFLEKKVDFVVAEVGMGGRLDATNVLNGIVTVITNISLEHTKTLGNSIKKIAKEKAGIIKENSYIVTSKKNLGFLTIKKIAKQKKSKIISPKYYTNFRTLNLQKPFKLKNAKINLHGDFQLENASLALGVIYCLQNFGFKFSNKEIKKGLEKTFWPARIQTISKNPLLIVDSTHTFDGAKELAKTLKKFSFKNLIIVFSCLQDKNFKTILKTLPMDKLIITKVDYKRALEPKVILKTFPKATIEKNMEFAIKKAKKDALKKDLILITGSIYGAGDALKVLNLKV